MYAFHTEPPFYFHMYGKSRDFGVHSPVLLASKNLDESKLRLDFSIQARIILLRTFSVSGNRN